MANINIGETHRVSIYGVYKFKGTNNKKLWIVQINNEPVVSLYTEYGEYITRCFGASDFEEKFKKIREGYYS